MKLTTRILDSGEYAAWDELVSQAENGSICSTTQYLDVLCAATGDTYRVVGVSNGGRIVGGIALYEQRSRWGKVISPRLLLPYNGFVYSVGESSYPSKRESAELGIQLALAEFLESERFAKTLIKCRHPIADIRTFIDRGWGAVATYTYLMDLSDMSAQWNRVDRNLKRLIKRCGSGEFELTDDRDFEGFFALHRQVHLRKGAPLYLEETAFGRYFQALADKGLARLFHARTPDGPSVASQIVLLGQNGLSHTIAAGSDEAFAQSGVNAYLRWSVFERLSAEGFKANDLTDASLNSVSRFKSQLGGDLTMSFALSRPPSLAFRIGNRASSVADAARKRLQRG